jgi:hypothetical protein
VCYLLCGALFVAHQVGPTVPQATSNRRRRFSVAHSLFVFVTIATIIFSAASFGSSTGCNTDIVLSLFVRIKFFGSGRDVTLFALALAMGSYITSLFRRPANRAASGLGVHHQGWKIASALAFCFFLLNTELLRVYNNTHPEDLQIRWGQVGNCSVLFV